MKVLSLDLSTTRTGWSLGEPGKVESFGSFKRPKDLEEDTDIFLWFAKEATQKAIEGNVTVVISEDWIRSPNPQQMLRSACLRGAVTVFLKDRMVVDTIFFTSSEWRKAAGVSLTDLPKGKGKKRPELKKRAIALAQSHGLDVKNDDEAEAACMLIGLKNLLVEE